MEINNINNIKFLSNENIYPLGIYTDINETISNQVLHTNGDIDINKKTKPEGFDFTLNAQNNDIIEILDNIKIKEGNSLEKIFTILEKKLETKLQIIKKDNGKNKIINLTKKYSAYKSIFEDCIKTIYEIKNVKSNKLLNYLLNGYNDIFQTLFMNYSKLHDKLIQGESIYQSKEKIIYNDLY
jgi:hypothetical protein